MQFGKYAIKDMIWIRHGLGVLCFPCKQECSASSICDY